MLFAPESLKPYIRQLLLFFLTKFSLKNLDNCLLPFYSPVPIFLTEDLMGLIFEVFVTGQHFPFHRCFW